MKSLILKIAKYLLKLALDETLRRGLPEIYKRIDAEIPLLLANSAPPVNVKGSIAGAISATLGKRATPGQVDAVIALYDPVKAASNLLQQRYARIPDSMRH